MHRSGTRGRGRLPRDARRSRGNGGTHNRDGGVRIGDLRANKGSDNYVVPDGAIAIDQDVTVLVWCEAFSVPVAKASQVAA